MHLEGFPFFISYNVVSLVTALSFGGNEIPGELRGLVQFIRKWVFN